MSGLKNFVLSLALLPMLAFGQKQIIQYNNVSKSGDYNSEATFQSLKEEIRLKAIDSVGVFIVRKKILTETEHSLYYNDSIMTKSYGVASITEIGERDVLQIENGLKVTASFDVSIDTGAVFAHYRELRAERIAAEKRRLEEENIRIKAEEDLKAAQKEFQDAKAEVAILEVEVDENKKDYKSAIGLLERANAELVNAKDAGADAVGQMHKKLVESTEYHNKKKTEYSSSSAKLETAKNRVVVAQNKLEMLSGNTARIYYSQGKKLLLKGIENKDAELLTRSIEKFKEVIKTDENYLNVNLYIGGANFLMAQTRKEKRDTTFLLESEIYYKKYLEKKPTDENVKKYLQKTHNLLEKLKIK